MSSALASMCILASFLYISEPVVDMRKEPKMVSEVVSQAVCSEEIRLIEIRKDWACIQTCDSCVGWIPADAYVSLPEEYLVNLNVSNLTAHVYEKDSIKFGVITTLPYNTKLCALDCPEYEWIQTILPDGSKGYMHSKDLFPEPTLSHQSELAPFSQKFLNVPYLWGGRSSFGFDGAGFVQMLYNKIGVGLKRSPGEQALDDRFQTVELSALEPGDLIFFGTSEHEIMHVGLYLGDETFIHSSDLEEMPWVRISKLSDFEWSGDAKAHYPYRMGRHLKARQFFADFEQN